MTERIFVEGNEAVGWGALNAGCDCYFGYPISPQNEIPEFFSREMPQRDKVFVQAQSETGTIGMLYGAAAIGVRAMTSTSSPGWGLMQEGMSNLSGARLPCVIVLVQRVGPAVQNLQHAQMDYNSVTKGGGGGGYKNIVLAPASVQETHDLVQLAFYLADKYRNPVVVLTDALMGHIFETLELKTLDFGLLPDKGDWALRVRGQRKNGKHIVAPAKGMIEGYIDYLCDLRQRYQNMEAELRYESHKLDDAELVLVAYGYCARVSEEAVNAARDQGLKAGLLRPITLWPFPYKVVKDLASRGSKFLVVEDSLGQMVDDVRMGAEGKSEVSLVDVTYRHILSEDGMIMPGRVLEEIRRLL